MANPLTDKERQKIVTLLREHEGNRYAVAKEVGRHPSTVGRVAREEGIESKSRNVAATKKATEARRAYAEERRLEIIGQGFDVAEKLLKACKDAGEFQKWSVGFGTLIDKARLETGKATARNESQHRKLSGASDEELAEFERILSGS